MGPFESKKRVKNVENPILLGGPSLWTRKGSNHVTEAQDSEASFSDVVTFH